MDAKVNDFDSAFCFLEIVQ